MKEKMPQNVIDWPSQSQYVNPIENLFAWLKKGLVKRGLKGLKDYMTAIWEGIYVCIFLEPYWRSMKKRCQILIDNNGYKITY